MLFYSEDVGGIKIPRFYPVNDDVSNIFQPSSQINLISHIKPRNHRQQISIDFLTSHKNGILKLEPGSGKTVVMIASICKLNKKAIIFVNKEKLRKQWKDEFLKHTNIKDSEISVLSTSNYKQALQSKIIISTVQAFAAIIKRKKEDFLRELNLAGLGISVFDECHTTVGPEVFSLASLNVCTEYTYGLSATPGRNDGCDDILAYHLGKVQYFDPGENDLLKPVVYMMYFPFEVYSKHTRYLMWGRKFSITKYHQQMIKSKKHSEVCAKLVKKFYNANRTSLILGLRTNSLLNIATLSECDKHDVGLFIPNVASAFPKSLEKLKEKALEIQDQKKKKLKVDKLNQLIKYKEEVFNITDTLDLDIAFSDKKCVYSTYNAARDGNSRDDFDSLIMTVPTTNVEQAAGRILRPLDGKNPIIIDLIDTEGPMRKSYEDPSKKVNWFIHGAQKRKEFYKSKDWIVKEIYL